MACSALPGSREFARQAIDSWRGDRALGLDIDLDPLSVDIRPLWRLILCDGDDYRATVAEGLYVLYDGFPERRLADQRRSPVILEG